MLQKFETFFYTSKKIFITNVTIQLLLFTGYT